MKRPNAAKKTAKNQRFDALDSLRGIAALIVVFTHSSLMIPEEFRAGLPGWVTYNPLRIFLNAYGAIILFFVLSGYVLALSFTRNKKLPYITYLTKRIFRIYVPFVFAILIAALLYSFSSPTPDGLGSHAFQRWWPTAPMTADALVQHLAMIGTIDQMWLDSPMWSLVYEMRISIIFPLLLILCRNSRDAIFLAVLLCLSAPALAIAFDQDWALDTSRTFAGTLLIALRYVPFFILGIILAHHNEEIGTWIKQTSRRKLWGIFILTLIIFYFPPEYLETSKEVSVAYHYIIGILLALASGYFILAARNMRDSAAWLNRQPLKWLGQISYSLYLLHLPILLFMFRYLLGEMPIIFILLFTIAVALAFATLFHFVFERPAMWFGKRIAERIAIQTR